MAVRNHADVNRTEIVQHATIHTTTDSDGDAYQFVECQCGGRANSVEALQNPLLHTPGCWVIDQ